MHTLFNKICSLKFLWILGAETRYTTWFFIDTVHKHIFLFISTITMFLNLPSVIFWWIAFFWYANILSNKNIFNIQKSLKCYIFGGKTHQSGKIGFLEFVTSNILYKKHFVTFFIFFKKNFKMLIDEVTKLKKIWQKKLCCPFFCHVKMSSNTSIDNLVVNDNNNFRT